jgi:hypothetical protein
MYERSAWDEAADQDNGIVGSHFKCAKGQYLLDEIEVPIGKNGIKICWLMPTLVTGQVLWANQKIVQRETGLMDAGQRMPRTRDDITPGWNPYVAITGIRQDGPLAGEFVTFTSTSWGGLFAVKSLISPYRFRSWKQFPNCTFETEPRGDANGNVDPRFRIEAWKDRTCFRELLAEPAPALPAPEASSLRDEEAAPEFFGAPGAAASIIEDDVF